ncbi:hypothetical protein FOA52_010972 [Chlamydomonas sp. UWO 241]|nr:hypothetical protein FOA52_010972 [Chlamydomonas sp. UWO 241]
MRLRTYNTGTLRPKQRYVSSLVHSDARLDRCLKLVTTAARTKARRLPTANYQLPTTGVGISKSAISRFYLRGASNWIIASLFVRRRLPVCRPRTGHNLRSEHAIGGADATATVIES